MQIPLPMRFSSYFDHDSRILVGPFLAGYDQRFPALPPAPNFTERFFDALAPVANWICATPANRWPVNQRGAQQDLDALSSLVGDEWVSSVVFGDNRLMRREFTINGNPAPLLAGWYNATLAYHIEDYARQERIPCAFVVDRGLYGFEIGSTLMVSDEPGMLPWFHHLSDVNEALRSAPVQIAGLKFKM
jgi:hypothetical protein